MGVNSDGTGGARGFFTLRRRAERVAAITRDYIARDARVNCG
jgi:hypothetical protein